MTTMAGIFCTSAFALIDLPGIESDTDEEVTTYAEGDKQQVFLSVKEGEEKNYSVTYDGEVHVPEMEVWTYSGDRKNPKGVKIEDLVYGTDYSLKFKAEYFTGVTAADCAESAGDKIKDAGTYTITAIEFLGTAAERYENAILKDPMTWTQNQAPKITILPVSVDFIVTGLNHTFTTGLYNGSKYHPTFTPKDERWVSEFSEVKFNYYEAKENGAADLSKPTDPSYDKYHILGGTFIVSGQLTTGNIILGQAYDEEGNELDKNNLTMTVSKQQWKVTFYYNNEEALEPQVPTTLYVADDTQLMQKPDPEHPGTPYFPQQVNVPVNKKFDAWYQDMDGDLQYSTGDIELYQPQIMADMNIVANWLNSDDATLKSLSVTDRNGVVLPLCGGNYQTPKEFDKETLEYFVRVPAATDRIVLNLDTTEQGSELSIDNNGKVLENARKQTIFLNSTVEEAPNTITIGTTAPDGTSSMKYKVHIQRLAVPAITLNYGNSPYGMIMNDATVTDKAVAKDSFDKTLIYNGVVPGMYYTASAWTSEVYDGYNGDKDDYAVFAYQREGFRDPGFTAVDSLGRNIDPEKVTRTMKVITISTGVPNFKEPGTTRQVMTNDTSARHHFSAELGSWIVRPGVYELTYTFTDEFTKQQVTNVRKVIFIGYVGDVNLDGQVSTPTAITADTTALEQNLYALNNTDSLYRYRVVDAWQDDNDVININDAGMIEMRGAGTEGFPKYYQELT